jgi:S-adenosylmethionine hydrolase
MDVPFVRTFSDVPLKRPLLYVDSRGHMALAVNQASFSEVYGVKPPVKISIFRGRK